MKKSIARLAAEKLLIKVNTPITRIASMVGLSRVRISQIKTALVKPSRAEVRELYNVDEVLRSITQDQEDRRNQQRSWIVI